MIWALLVASAISFFIFSQIQPSARGIATQGSGAAAKGDVRHVQQLVTEVNRANRVGRVGPFEIEREF